MLGRNQFIGIVGFLATVFVVYRVFDIETLGRRVEYSLHRNHLSDKYPYGDGQLHSRHTFRSY